MNRKYRRRLLRMLSRVPGAYATLAFLAARRVKVSGWSMAPTFIPDERLTFDRLAFARDRPQRGDVVLVAHPLRRDLSLVKRIARLPGEVTDDAQTLARGEYWVEGDNADGSTDSREFGPVKRSDLQGRAWFVYWPAERWRVINRSDRGGDWLEATD